MGQDRIAKTLLSVFGCTGLPGRQGCGRGGFLGLFSELALRAACVQLTTRANQGGELLAAVLLFGGSLCLRCSGNQP